MGTIFPGSLRLDTLDNDAERNVVLALIEQLNDNWIIAPNVRLSGERDYELDVIVAHPRDGYAVIEVKGHVPNIIDGRWFAHGQPMKPQPLDQARTNAYQLRDHVRRAHPSMRRLDVEYGIALPNAETIDGNLPLDCDPAQVICAPDLLSMRDAIDRLMTYRYRNLHLGEVGIERLLNMLGPSAEFSRSAELATRLASARLDERSNDRISALESLDLNRRVCVTGAAGSGKTRLADRWAGRAILRNERVLLTCFNLPLAGRLRTRLTNTTDLRIAAFFEYARSLDLPPLDEPDDADSTWWEGDLVDHLEAHWHLVDERFDTIIIDEAQDFHPRWITLLERLLTDHGRLLMVADPSQEIYPRGFTLPEHGWTRCHLTDNCRNSRDIARLLRDRFNGGTAPDVAPDSETITTINTETIDDLIDAVGDTIDHLLDDRDHATINLFVGTFSTALRDRLRDALALVAWEDRDPYSIVCENVHRVKGLEFHHVILTCHDEHPTDELLYVGASRAIHSLTTIGPTDFTNRLQPNPEPTGDLTG